MEEVLKFLHERTKILQEALRHDAAVIETEGDDYVWQTYKDKIGVYATKRVIDMQPILDADGYGDASDKLLEEVKRVTLLLISDYTYVLDQAQPDAFVVVRQYPTFYIESSPSFDSWVIGLRWRMGFPKLKIDGWKLPDLQLPF